MWKTVRISVLLFGCILSWRCNTAKSEQDNILSPWIGETRLSVSDGLEPDCGGPAATFFYQVYYLNTEDNPPQFVRIHILAAGSEISGSPFPMVESDSNDVSFKDGKKYRYSTSLEAGKSYFYWFEAGDGVATTIRLPASGQFEGPIVAKIEATGSRGTIGTGSDEIILLKLSGEPYGMGYWHGYLLANEIKQCYQGFLDYFKAFVSDAELDRIYQQLDPYIPLDHKIEMQGLVDGAAAAGVEITLDQVRRVHTIPEASEWRSCSAFAAHGRATRDSLKMIQVRILDWNMETSVQNYPLLIDCRPNGKRAFVNPTWVGFIGCVSGMNEEGIAVSEMGSGKTISDDETFEGLTMPFLLRHVLETSRDIQEVTDMLQNAKRTCNYYYVIGDGQALQARLYVTSASVFKVFKEGEAPFPDSRYAVEDAVYAGHYMDRMWQQLKPDGPHWGNIDVQAAVEVNKVIATSSNLHSIIYENSNLRIWVANAEGSSGRACDQAYVLYEFGSIPKSALK